MSERRDGRGSLGTAQTAALAHWLLAHQSDGERCPNTPCAAKIDAQATPSARTTPNKLNLHRSSPFKFGQVFTGSFEVKSGQRESKFVDVRIDFKIDKMYRDTQSDLSSRERDSADVEEC